MPSISTRSASISSASTTSSKCSDGGIKKKFCCSFPSCGKSFSRSEHLHRHALNHKDGTNTCLRCSAHFRRRDLLDRHMARHKEKDDEAGGEGLGVLATRKRLWKDSNGNIVNARRPSYTQEGAKRRQISRVDRKSSRNTSISSTSSISREPSVVPHNSMTRTGSAASSTIIVDSGVSLTFEARLKEEERDFEDEMGRQDSWLDMHTNLTALPSPPISESRASSEEDALDGELDVDVLYQEASWPPLPHDGGLAPLDTRSGHAGDETPSLSSGSGEGSPYFGSSSWGSATAGNGTQPFQTFMGAMAELPYDDIFKPEAGLYEWQTWNSQVLMSRCREEKYDPSLLEDRAPVVVGGGFGQDRERESWRRAFGGLGTC